MRGRSHPHHRKAIHNRPDDKHTTAYLLQAVRDNGGLAKRVAEYRALEDEKVATEFKRTRFLAASFSCLFLLDDRGIIERGNDSPKAYSGIRDVGRRRQGAGGEVRRCGPVVMGSFLSVGGNGVQIAVHISPLPKTSGEHTAAYYVVKAAFEDSLGVVVDDLKDVARLTFLSSDPAAIVRPTPRETREFRWQ